MLGNILGSVLSLALAPVTGGTSLAGLLASGGNVLANALVGDKPKRAAIASGEQPQMQPPTPAVVVQQNKPTIQDVDDGVLE